MRISDWSSDVCLPIWRALPRPARTRDRAAQSARMGADRHRDADRRRTHGARSVQRRRGGAGDRRARRPAARKAALDAREGAYAMQAVGRNGEARAGWAMASPALAAIQLFFVLHATASMFLGFTVFAIFWLADTGNPPHID